MRLLFLALLLFFLASALPAGAIEEAVDHTSEAEQALRKRISEIDNKIMLECIKLARFNVLYHKAVNKKGFVQEWVYPMERELGTALNFSNTIVDLSQRARGLNNPSLVSRSSLRHGLICATIGQSITGTSSGIALLTNLRETWDASREGYSPAHAIATVKQLAETIDLLLITRTRLLVDDEIHDSNKNLILQGRVLEHLRNQLVFEFKTWSIASREVEWSENVFFAIDSLQGYTQMASSCLSLRTFPNINYGGAAAITNLTANTMVTLNPIIRTLAGRLAERHQHRLLERELPYRRPREIYKVLADFGRSPTEAGAREMADTEEAQELAFLVRRSSEMDNPINQEVQKLQKLRRIADQQAISGPLIGLTGVTRGILNTTAYYSNINHPLPNLRSSSSNSGSSTSGSGSSGSSSSSSSSGSSNSSSSSSSISSTSSSQSTGRTRAQNSRLLSNRLNFTGRLVQATGQAYSLVVTPVTEVRHYIYKRNLKLAGRSPEQVFKRRLAKLDELEMRVKAYRF